MAIWLQGDTGALSNAPNGVGRSTFDFLLGDGSYVESKFGTSQLSTAQRTAASQDYAGADLCFIGANSIGIQRREGTNWPTVEIQFDRRSRPSFNIIFAALP